MDKQDKVATGVVIFLAILAVGVLVWSFDRFLDIVHAKIDKTEVVKVDSLSQNN